MKKILSYIEYLTESVELKDSMTRDGKKPSIVFKVKDLTYEILHEMIEDKWGKALLPNTSGVMNEFVFFIGEPNSRLEKIYREKFEKWKTETLKRWGKDIEIFLWNMNKKSPTFLFKVGSSKLWDEFEKLKLTSKMDPDSLHDYYHGSGSKGRYFGD